MTEYVLLDEQEEECRSQQNGPALICRCASEIDPEPIAWLWSGRIAVGKHTLHRR